MNGKGTFWASTIVVTNSLRRMTLKCGPGMRRVDKFLPNEHMKPLVFFMLEANNKWWYMTLWKWYVPQKIKLFSWLLLENKTLTWDNSAKKGGNWTKHLCSLSKGS